MLNFDSISVYVSCSTVPSIGSCMNVARCAVSNVSNSCMNVSWSAMPSIYCANIFRPDVLPIRTVLSVVSASLVCGSVKVYIRK